MIDGRHIPESDNLQVVFNQKLMEVGETLAGYRVLTDCTLHMHR